MVELAVGIAIERGQAIAPMGAGIDRAADVERALLALMRPPLQDDLADRIGRRALAAHVDEATGRSLAIEHRRRPLAQFDAFEAIGFDIAVQPVELLAQPIAEHSSASTIGAEVAAEEILHALPARTAPTPNARTYPTPPVQPPD